MISYDIITGSPGSPGSTGPVLPVLLVLPVLMFAVRFLWFQFSFHHRSGLAGPVPKREPRSGPGRNISAKVAFEMSIGTLV